MNRKGPIVLTAIVLLVPIGALAQMQGDEGTSLHHFDLSCDTCHELSVTRSEANVDRFAEIGAVNGDINQLCASSNCHSSDPVLSHPVGLRAEGVVGEGMQLDGDLRLTCLTCHEQQQTSDGLNDTDYERERSLYVPEGVEFCASCHMNTGGSLSKRSHWRFSTRAHLVAMNPDSGGNASRTEFVNGIDTESLTCLSCHDEVTATIPAENETHLQKKIRWQSMSDHPIGMDYASVAMRDMGEYKYLQFNDQPIRLFDGNVGCGSCHSLYAQTKNSLVVRNERGFLCRQCHNK